VGTCPADLAPRHPFDIGLGLSNLVDTRKGRLSVRFSVLNLTNKRALYNFLSTFSGTHFVPPRTYQAELRWRF
jgi:outer membrane receptor protein involved in Fe transport